ncbi:5' nucleotidase, NT5C type [Pseudobutyrivibrio sp.]|uniref:5' nucleotidase, NT5C type n=1 Tax=Pseudobutyrivibrio sp. TaxID=2014367 RepID=UPI001DF60210|nr:2-dehydropantoate 2-reductase [Pseudobutyrivibrio sp.]MBE5912387.1 2-dehydropantoate 2-reductase [Pseudobutyrivibrio sp.]
MRFYVDFDDCLCETAKSFTEIAKRLFGKEVPYEDVRFFNLQKAFDLTDDEYTELMVEGHKSEILLSYEETPGASRVLNKLIDNGHEVFIITGRPYNTYEQSRKWLDEHGLDRVKLFFLNKYGRDFFISDSSYNLELEDFYKMTFDYAIEDSPMAFKYFNHLPDLKIMVFDRPWNRECEFPNEQYKRCIGWDWIEKEIIC